MSKLIFQPTLGTNWEKIYQANHKAQKIDDSSRYVINPFILPVLAESRILVAVASSEYFLSTWRFAGSITPIMNCNGAEFVEASLEPIALPCNAARLMVLPEFSSTYKLQYSCPWWIDDVTLTVYQYTGNITEEPEGFLSELRTRLTNIESAVT